MRAILVALLILGCCAAGLASAAPVDAPRTFASTLAVPWDVLALPDGRVLIPERSERRIRVVMPDGSLRPAPAWSEPSANKVLGIDRHPDYATNRFVYAYVTYGDGSRVIRLTDDGTNLVDPQVVFPGPIPTDGSHDGGRIRFGPDRKLYVTTGDIHDPDLPRDPSSLNGKILRLNDDGTAPADNPFAERADDGRFVYSLGHRHPQGIAWDATGRMWESEHGPSGEAHAPLGEKTGNDEINLIVPGGDYGWPDSSGEVVAPGTIRPAWVAGDAAVAPGGMVFAPDGRLYVPMLAGRHLHVYLPSGDTLVDEGSLYPGTRLRAASMIGCTLAFSTDEQNGASDEVRAVTLAPCDPPPPPSATPAPASPPPAGDPATAPTATADAARRLARKIRTKLRRIGARRLSARRAVTVRVGGLPAGRLTARVRRLRAGRPRMTIARGGTTAGARTVAVRLRITRAGRSLLRRSRAVRMRAGVTHRAVAAQAQRETLAFTVRR